MPFGREKDWPIKQKAGLAVTLFAGFHTTEGDVLDADRNFVFCGLVETKTGCSAILEKRFSAGLM